MCRSCDCLENLSWRLTSSNGYVSGAHALYFEKIDHETFAAYLSIGQDAYKLSPIFCHHGFSRSQCVIYYWDGKWAQEGVCDLSLSVDPVLSRIDARFEHIFYGSAGKVRNPWGGVGDPLAGGWGAEGAGTGPGGVLTGGRPPRERHSY